MKQLVQLVPRIVFSLAVLAALGFGARQALAEPAERSAGPACVSSTCDYYCITHGANYGICVNGTCTCRSGP
jgi:hypothetical protein